MLLVRIFAKLILLAVRETSDLHATFAMADHAQHEELAAPTLPTKMGLGGLAVIASQKHVLAPAPVCTVEAARHAASLAEDHQAAPTRD